VSGRYPVPPTAAEALLVDCGLELVPARPGSNAPDLPGWPSGFSRAALEHEARRRPTANVCLLMRGLYALDADGPAAAEQLRRWLVELIGVDVLDPSQAAVWAQRTPSGGLHVILRCPAGVTIPSRAYGRLGIAALDTAGPGVDHAGVELIGEGKVLCLAPSVRASGTYVTLGTRYLDPAEAPAALAAALAHLASPDTAAPEPVDLELVGELGDLEAAAALITELPEGHRNATAYRVCSRIVRQARLGATYSETDAGERLERAMLAAGLTRAEAASTWRSATRSDTAARPAPRPTGSDRQRLEEGRDPSEPWLVDEAVPLAEVYRAAPAFDPTAAAMADASALLEVLVEEQHARHGTPPSYAIAGALHAVAAANAGRYQLADPTGSDRAAGRFSQVTLVLGASGVGKSGSLLAERQLLEAVEPAREQHELERGVQQSWLGALRQRVAVIERQLQHTSEAPAGVHVADPLEQLRAAHADVRAAEQSAARFSHAHSIGGTPQGHETELARNGALIVSSPEGIVVLRSYLGQRGQASNTAQLVTWLDGQSGSVSFATQAARVVTDPALAMLLQLQPSALEEVLLQDAAALTNGLAARCLAVYAEHDDPLVTYGRLDPVVIDELRSRLATLAAQAQTVGHPLATWTPEARHELEAFRLQMTAREAISRAPAHEQACRARAAQNAARYAGLVHLLEHPASADAAPISLETARAGIRLQSYSMAVLGYVLEPTSSDRVADLALALAERLVDLGPGPFTFRDVRRGFRRSSITDEQRTTALQRLVDCDWLRARTARAANRQQVQQLHPHPHLASLLELERQRREGRR
jgi:hypothetical protein